MRTEQVYEKVLSTPPLLFGEQLLRVHSIGQTSGKMFSLVAIFMQWYLMLCEYFYPARLIEIVDDWNLVGAQACLKRRAVGASSPGHVKFDIYDSVYSKQGGNSDESASGDAGTNLMQRRSRGRSRTRKRATSAEKTPSPERPNDLSMSPVPHRRRKPKNPKT